MRLAREYGPIYWLDMMGKPVIVVSGFALVDELCDETRFDKSVRGALRRLRAFAGDGLFTAETQEPNWSQGPQHPAAELQPARDAGLPPDDARHRRAAGAQVGAAERRTTRSTSPTT